MSHRMLGKASQLFNGFGYTISHYAELFFFSLIFAEVQVSVFVVTLLIGYYREIASTFTLKTFPKSFLSVCPCVVFW